MSADNACNWCFCWRTEVWGREKMWKSQTQRCTSLNPRGSVSRTTPPQSGVPWRDLNSCSLLGRAGHQVARATASRVVGWKVDFWSSYLLQHHRGLIVQQRAGWFHPKLQYCVLWCLVEVLRAANVSDGPDYSRLVSWSERRMDLCLKRPSFYCLIHFYKRCVSSLAQMGRSPWVRSGWVSVLSVTTFFIEG